ncbi:MAG: CAI-1 autoinducer sensor kinase/phosphatase CqsS [Syntrophorhabdaceae bacterium PtaU1.Bin034]|jgi:CheY-like chemotaxis protein|nr:MAG: CAI-1 autoinducer sensor kinase/phosphatase CqsS [Syntrophorhabdaceae bacterium PtaU1.Bin034]
MVRDRKPRVMIIDENSGVRQFYTLELVESGYDVITVEDAAAFKEAVGRSRPDLIILDPWIGGRHRWDILSGIKEDHALVPVLLCLAFDVSFPNDVAPAEGFVLKSSLTADFLLKVEEIMGVSRKRKLPKNGGSIWTKSRR